MALTKHIGNGIWQLIDANGNEWHIKKRTHTIAKQWDGEVPAKPKLGNISGANKKSVVDKIIKSFGIKEVIKEVKTPVKRNPYNVFIKAKGMALGQMWDGNYGGYPTIELQHKTLDGIKEQAERLLSNNKLTGTGDFQRIKGAYLVLNIITTKMFKGKLFTNDEVNAIFIGNLTEGEKDFLQRTY